MSPILSESKSLTDQKVKPLNAGARLIASLTHAGIASLVKEHVAAMDSDTVADWAALMSFVQARIDGDFGDI